jgi:hypothetical protein
MERMHRLALAALFALSSAAGACAGPPMPTPIENEPICPDFEAAPGRKMKGSLHYPVMVRLYDGKNVVAKAMVNGRDAADPPARISVVDDNAEYKVEWAQCPNERAPTARTKTGHEPKDAAPYECGEPAVYKTEQHTTKRGDAASHKLSFPAPPKTECWTAPAAPKAAEASAAASASAAPSASAVVDAEAASSSSPAASASADASAAPSASAAEAPPKKK